MQALGLPPPDASQKRHRGDRQEMATDEAVRILFRARRILLLTTSDG
jgi:hypothetical protein